MKKSITKNYIYNLMYQILILILPLVTTPYVSRILGAENLGIYSYTVSITTFFILFGALGIGLYGQRQIAYQQEDKNKYSITFWEIAFLKCITLGISLVIFYFTFAIGKNDYNTYYKILIFEIIGNMLDITWFFTGLEEFKKTVSRNTLVKIISVISIFIFVKTKSDLYKYFIIYVISVLLGNISLWLYLPKYLKKIDFRKIKLSKHIKPVIGLFIPQVAIQLYTILDKAMIGTIISDKSEVGYYEQSQKIVKLLLTIITSIGTVMLPRIANIFAKGETDKINKYMNLSFRAVFFLAFPIIFGLIAVADAFVPIFLGSGYTNVIRLMKIISPIILLIGISNVTGVQYLLPTKRQRQYTTSVVMGAIVNFIANMLLISKFGAIGASIGTVLAEGTVTGIQIFFTRKDFQWKNILKCGIHYLVLSIVFFVPCIMLKFFINDNILLITLQIIVGIVIYSVLLLLSKDKMIVEILNIIKNKKIEKAGQEN